MKKYLKRGISLFLGVCLVLSILVLPGVIVAEAEATTSLGPNLISSGTFEKESDTEPGTYVADSGDWGNESQYTIVENTDPADIEKVGYYSLKMVTADGAGTATYVTGNANAGKSYTFTVTYKYEFTARKPQVIIYFKDADGTPLATNSKDLAAATTWTEYTVTYEAPANTASYQISLNCAKKAVGTVYFDNISFAEKVTTFELKGATVDLGNSLDMNFYIDPADLTDGETYTAEIVRSYADGTADDVQTVTVDPAKADANNNNYIYVTYSDIAAKEMGDEIKVTIYDSANNAVSQTWTDSVAQYIGRVVADNGDNAELLAVCADLLNYGAAAQNKFSYDTGNLVDSDLSDIRTVTVTGEATTAEAKKGTTLTLKSNILMEMFFYKDKVGEATTATVSYTNHNGAVVNKVVDLTEDAYYTDALSVQIDGLVIADINTVVTVTVGDVTVTDTMAWFVARSESADIYNAILALGDSAYAYFH